MRVMKGRWEIRFENGKSHEFVKVLPSETVPREPFQLTRRSQKVIHSLTFCLSHAKTTSLRLLHELAKMKFCRTKTRTRRYCLAFSGDIAFVY